MNQLTVAAKAYLDAGLSIIPIYHKSKRPAWWLLPQKVAPNGAPLFTKRLTDNEGRTIYAVTTEDTGSPKGSWEPYQQRQATPQEVQQWLRSGIQSLAIVAGPASGGVEIIDFDMRNGENWFARWEALAGDPIRKYGLALQMTGSGGYQVGFRSEHCEGNLKLAWAEAPEEASERKVMIETRGRGGYFLAPPSLHPNGSHYRLISGKFSRLPLIDAELRAHLLDCALQLNQAELPEPATARHTDYTASAGNDVADAYNREHPIEIMLNCYGYTQHGDRWSRPGKTDSLGLTVFNDGKAYAFSSNDLLAADRLRAGERRPFTSFDLYAHYEYNADYKAATKAAAAEMGIAFADRLHTLLYVEGRDNARFAREAMYEHGWVVRNFSPSKINLENTRRYETVIVWAYSDALARHMATSVLPGAYPLVVPGKLDAQAMVTEGILQPYLEAALADARRPVEVATWTL